jgi:hypothetical protein
LDNKLNLFFQKLIDNISKKTCIRQMQMQPNSNNNPMRNEDKLKNQHESKNKHNNKL